MLIGDSSGEVLGYTKTALQANNTYISSSANYYITNQISKPVIQYSPQLGYSVQVTFYEDNIAIPAIKWAVISADYSNTALQATVTSTMSMTDSTSSDSSSCSSSSTGTATLGITIVTLVFAAISAILSLYSIFFVSIRPPLSATVDKSSNL